MLTIEQHAEFKQRGLVRLPAAIARADVDRMCDSLWTSLARHGVDRDSPDTWTSERISGIQSFSTSEDFAALGNATVCSALDDLFGPAGWEPPPRWGQPLVTFPTSRKWDLPHASWHLDERASRSRPNPPGAVVFTYLAPVLERGGGTVVLAGSHRLVEDYCAGLEPADEGRSADVRKALNRAEPWLRALWSRDDKADRIHRFMIEGAVIRGVPVKVIELTGAPGDVIIWNPWLFHCATSNSRPQPRLMLRQPIYRPAT